MTLESKSLANYALVVFPMPLSCTFLLSLVVLGTLLVSHVELLPEALLNIDCLPCGCYSHFASRFVPIVPHSCQCPMSGVHICLFLSVRYLNAVRFRPTRNLRVANCSQIHRRDGGRPAGPGQVRGGGASAAGGDPHHSRRAPSCPSGRPPPP